MPLSSFAVPLIVTIPLTILLFVGAVMFIVGGLSTATLFTVTDICAFAVLLAVSVAISFIVCVPLVNWVVSTAYVYGAAVSVLLTTLSMYNATALTPLSSLAVPLIVAVPVNVALFAGAVIATIGGLSTGAGL